MRYLHSTIKFVIRISHFDLYYLYSSTKCNVLEIEAINILRGFHISDYVKKYENLEKGIVTGDSTKFKANRELLLKMAELEDEVKNAAMANEGLYN